MNIEFPDEVLAAQWENINWDAAEKKLADWQFFLSGIPVDIFPLGCR